MNDFEARREARISKYRGRADAARSRSTEASGPSWTAVRISSGVGPNVARLSKWAALDSFQGLSGVGTKGSSPADVRRICLDSAFRIVLYAVSSSMPLFFTCKMLD